MNGKLFKFLIYFDFQPLIINSWLIWVTCNVRLNLIWKLMEYTCTCYFRNTVSLYELMLICSHISIKQKESAFQAYTCMYTCTCVDRAFDDYLRCNYVSYIVRADVYKCTFFMYIMLRMFSHRTRKKIPTMKTESKHAHKFKVMGMPPLFSYEW